MSTAKVYTTKTKQTKRKRKELNIDIQISGSGTVVPWKDALYVSRHAPNEALTHFSAR